MDDSMSAAAPKVYPCLSYRDPAAACAFLARAFGFHPMLQVPDDDGCLVHAEMSLGPAVIMLGSARPDMKWISPLDLPGRNATTYVYVDDVDGHYARARAAGARISRELAETSYGAREYSALDPEGQEWHFGTYCPVPAPSSPSS
jgi:uncharacterized glyoxalase superfamily protein PhnB